VLQTAQSLEDRNLSQSRICLLPAVCLLVLMVAGCAQTSRTTDASIERLQLSHPLAAGPASIEIDNPWGDVYVRRSDSREVFVHAVVQRLGANPAEPRVSLDGDAHQARIQARFAGAGSDCHQRRHGGGRLGRADLTVFVPVDVSLRIRSDCDGRINTHHVQGDLEARTDQGSIEVSASGRARLHSHSGSIRAFVELDSAEPSQIGSDGSIVLTMPPAVRADLRARACAGLRARGFSWLSETPRRECVEGHALLGDEGSSLRVDSRHSFVEIRLRGSARQ